MLSRRFLTGAFVVGMCAATLLQPVAVRAASGDPTADQIRAKEHLLELYIRAKTGQASAEEVSEYGVIVSAMPHRSDLRSVAPIGAAAAVTPLATSSASVPKTQASQERGFWCGPASAYSIVRAWNLALGHTTTSQYTGHPALSQYNLAGANYTGAGYGTTGSTDYATGDMERALNRWLGLSSTTGVYIREAPSDAFGLSWRIMSDVDLGWMVAADTIEPKKDAQHPNVTENRYNNHPRTVEIYHWTTVYGYQAGGDEFLMQDPADSNSATHWTGVARYFTMTADWLHWYGMHNGVDNSRGIVW